MKIALVTPARPITHSGNANTAMRWARLLRELGHRVRVQTSWDGRRADLMIALHALRSRDSIVRFASEFPDQPLVLMLTGTDLYRDIRASADAIASLQVATRLIVLQSEGLKELSPALRRKTRVIYQSALPAPRIRPRGDVFEICVSGHLREVKDPFRTAAALKTLPPQSHIAVTHIGGALDDAMARQARQWMRVEPRYRWLGEVTPARAMRHLARSRLLVISSHLEGGANVVTEALTARVPVIASRVPGNVGMLGRDYRGYYRVSDERSLARLLWRAESDPIYYRTLQRQCLQRRKLTSVTREKQALRKLMRELCP
jgi:putative glycosyltransferase (TIGR04348 family)